MIIHDLAFAPDHEIRGDMSLGALKLTIASGKRFNDTHPSVAWLKFAALAEGARLATKQLWG